GSFWHQLGLAEGDRLERLNGESIDSMDRWQRLLRAAETDQEISVVVRRDGQRLRFHTKTVPPRSGGKPT
ncbi:MAG: PDZ domain-containing protein, partial [Myxococcota bacterium]